MYKCMDVAAPSEPLACGVNGAATQGGRLAAGARQPGAPAAGPDDAAQLPARIIVRGAAPVETDWRGLCGLIVRVGHPDMPRASHPPGVRGTRVVSHCDALPAPTARPPDNTPTRNDPGPLRHQRGVPGPRRTTEVRLCTIVRISPTRTTLSPRSVGSWPCAG
ncbi:hypothetical protein GCM10022416_19240 [Actinomadura keratinilytica]|uniref:Uncharacterized protein n=1 Tax=Actinomadura keratinilytica TaxID=547461 RepID=A0ABP7YGP1_9ACTN